MGNKKDALEVFFDDEARSILFRLVDRNTIDPTWEAGNDYFEPTISAIFKLFHEIMNDNTPDLYQSEWLRLARSIENTRLQRHQLPSDTSSARSKLVMSLEDTNSIDGEINNFELSKKLAGFDGAALCSILYHLQQYFVAKRRDQKFEFPKIEYKG